MPRTGLEPARLAALAPETSASTIPPPGLFHWVGGAKVSIFSLLVKFGGEKCLNLSLSLTSGLEEFNLFERDYSHRAGIHVFSQDDHNLLDWNKTEPHNYPLAYTTGKCMWCTSGTHFMVVIVIPVLKYGVRAVLPLRGTSSKRLATFGTWVLSTCERQVYSLSERIDSRGAGIHTR